MKVVYNVYMTQAVCATKVACDKNVLSKLAFRVQNTVSCLLTANVSVLVNLAWARK